ncbi:sensor histidine kinase [Carboxylicivirga sp. RSCT41]|uniref:sensor histidine kinase n=1 Tax=Carboxylicivirga agarovorans TaxID=3417570 RepID=UPI003D3571EE
MYLNQQIINHKTIGKEAFYFLLDKTGHVIRSHGDLIDRGVISVGANIRDFLPHQLRDRFNSFVNNEGVRELVAEVVMCDGDDLEQVKCTYKGFDGNIELIGTFQVQTNQSDIAIDKLPYPIAVVKKDGEIFSLNRSFIDFFLESRIVVRPIYIQDIIKTNVLSPEKFDYLKMIESDANSRAVLCHFKGTEANQTFLLNLIPYVNKDEELYLAAVKDLTQFIEVQQNLEDQNEELKRQIQDEFRINKAHELKLLKKSRLESLGEIASAIFHELNQPLTHLSLKLDNMFDKWQMGDISESYLLEKTEQIQHQIMRMRGIIDEMKQFSSLPDRKDESISIQEVLNCALEDISYMQVQGLILVVKHVDEVFVEGTANELEQVFVNILMNSVQSLQMKSSIKKGFKPKLTVSIEQTEELVRVIFIDNGLGAQEKDIANLFKPFYTTKKSSGGTGLGLFIIKNLMRKMKGSIDVQTREGRYFKTTLTFPAIK